LRTAAAFVVALSVVSGCVASGGANPPGGDPSPGGIGDDPPPPSPGTPVGLDATGARVPDTAFPVPSGAVFLATNGRDANAGTQAAPVATLNRAVALASEGDTIVVRGGVYRDWHHNADSSSYDVVDKALTIQAYPHEQVWFDGSDVVPTARWVSGGFGLWYAEWATPSFCAGDYYERPTTAQRADNTGPCAHKDMATSPQAPIPGDPQMAFVDGVQLTQKPALSELDASSFYYDWQARRIYLGTNPAGHTVELAARPTALVMGGAGNTVRGVGFRRYATNQYHNVTGAALYMGGSEQNRVESAVFANNAGGGLSVSNPRPGSYVRLSVFARNGYTALGSNGGATQGRVNDFVIEHNVFNGNNASNFGWGCTASCGQANVKLGHMNGFIFRDNIVDNGVGRASGFWCDLDCRDGLMVGNLVRNNGGHGIYYEVSSDGIIASNVVTGSGQPGITVASATTRVYNNTLVNNQFGLWVYDDSRSPGVDGWDDVGPDTADVELVNNVITDAPYYLIKSQDPRADLSINTRPSDYYAEFDHNAYYRANGADQNLHNWIEGSSVYYSSSAEMVAATGWDRQAVDITSGADPFFVDPRVGDYRVRQGSPAYQSGQPLPGDIASLVGADAGTPISRGAVDWPGRRG
jgi:parallel beta-helix repeat protein